MQHETDRRYREGHASIMFGPNHPLASFLGHRTPLAALFRSFRGWQSVRVGVDRRTKPGAPCLFVLKPTHTAVCSSLTPVALVADVSCLFVLGVMFRLPFVPVLLLQALHPLLEQLDLAWLSGFDT